MRGVVRTAARAAGTALAEDPFPVALDVPGRDVRLNVSRALYLAYTAAGELHYIGKVDRDRGATGARLREHLRSSLQKRRAWRWLWVIPVTDALSSRELLALEARLIAAYRPPGNVQHAGP